MHTADIIIFAVFFIVNLIIGIIYRGRKKTFKEYAIGNKNFSTAAITATIVASWASGSLFFSDLEQTYSNGLYYVIAIILGGTLGLLITGYIIGPRMGVFLNHVSMADALSNIYGKNVQLITAISTLLTSIGYVAIQFKVISKILSALFNYYGPEVTIIAASIIIIYSAFGGIKSVTFADIFQFITFGTMLPVLALVIWHHMPNPSQAVIHTLTTHPNFDFKQVVSWTPRFIGTLALMFYCMTPSLPPELFQRMAMGRDIRQVKRSIAYAAGILLVIELFIIWIAILLLSENPNLSTSEVIGYLIKNHTYAGLRGFLGVGIIALAMSTADAALNSCSVLVANDILPPLKITKQASVRVAAITTFIIGFFATLLTLSIQNILEILLFSANFYFPILVVPMLLTIFGFRTSKRIIYIGMGAGFVTTALLLLYFQNVNSFFPGMLANLVFLLGSHYLLGEKGGWTHWKQPQEEKGIEVYGSYPLTWRERWQAIKNFSIQAYLEKCLPNKGYYYPLMAFYLLTASYFSFYNLPLEVQQNYLIMYRTVQYTTLAIATTLLGFAFWPITLKQNKRFLAWMWPSILLCTLFFVGGMVVVMSGFESIQVLVFMLNLVMAVLLSSWQLAIALAVIGLTAAVWVFNTFLGDIVPIQNALSIPFQIGYGLLLFSSVLIALFRFKQANQDLESKHEQLRTTHQATIKDLSKSRRYEERFVRALDTEGMEIFQEIINTSKLLEEQAKKVDAKVLPASFVENMVHWTEQIDLTTHYLQTLAHRAISYMRLSVETASLDKILKELAELLRIQDVVMVPQIKIHNRSKARELEADLGKIKQLLVSAILYAQEKQLTNPRPITLWIEDTHLGYLISDEKGHLKEVLALGFVVTTTEQPIKIETVYIGKTTPDKVLNPQIADHVNLNTNQHVIEAHYGYMSVSKQDEVITQFYVIPRYVGDVRPKEIDAPEMDVDTYLPPSNENYPGAAEQEAAFLEAVRTQTTADMAMVNKALRIIKKYHGPVKRKSGEPFYLHPITAATIALGFTKDPDVIIGALLHDLVEDTAFSLPQVGLMFNTRIQRIVDGVTHFYSDLNTLHKIKLATHENINKLLQAEDRSMLYVKLSDRLHNMRTIQFHSKLEKRKQIAEETLLFFVPIAQHLGLKDVEVELQKRSAEVLAQLE